MSESDVYGRQILPTKVDPRALRAEALKYVYTNQENNVVFFNLKS